MVNIKEKQPSRGKTLTKMHVPTKNLHMSIQITWLQLMYEVIQTLYVCLAVSRMTTRSDTINQHSMFTHSLVHSTWKRMVEAVNVDIELSQANLGSDRERLVYACSDAEVHQAAALLSQCAKSYNGPSSNLLPV